MRSLRVLGCLFWLLASPSLVAESIPADEAPLDPAPSRVLPVVESMPRLAPFDFEAPLWKSDLQALVSRQTRVKNQGKRGTCNIFATTGIVESIYKIARGETLDLNENYLEFQVQTRMKQQATAGSEVYHTIPAIQYFGAITQGAWPYEEYDWTLADVPPMERDRARQICAGTWGNQYSACLLTHKNPASDEFSQYALRFRTDFRSDLLWYRPLQSQDEIRRILGENRPVLLTLQFFYGAWNHRKMPELGIGPRDMDKWDRGVVGVPTQRDIALSAQAPAGHSIVIVGYDESRRVYFFKNSWGTSGFGVTSNLLGPGTTIGYGTIPYDYAHRYATFYEVGLRQ